MSTKVYLDLVRRPPQGGKPHLTGIAAFTISSNVPPNKIFFFFFCIMTSENTFITETEASEKNLNPGLGPLV